MTQLAAPPRTAGATAAAKEATDEPGDEATIDVTFRVPAGAKAHSAHVCGEFNDWSMAEDSFVLTRTLPVGRSWRFYLVDGTRWENDAAADDYPANDFGDHDSVVDLRSPSTSPLVYRSPVQSL